MADFSSKLGAGLPRKHGISMPSVGTWAHSNMQSANQFAGVIMGPLAGIKIIDMTSVLMGPYATQILGDMGADVMKIEAPEGDLIRQIGPARNPGMGALFLNTNRSKRSVCLDLKQPEGRAALLALLKEADVLVHNLRPQAMQRLGLSFDDLSALYPRLVYASLCGFASKGPYADKAAYDDLIQGGAVLSSLMAEAGDGTPRYVPTALADRTVGLAAVGAICAALVHRERSGNGQALEVPMFETMLGIVLGDHLSGATFEPPLPGHGYQRLLSRDRRPYRTQDGYICALVYNDRHWRDFLAEIGMSELQSVDERFATFANRTTHIDYVYAFLAAKFLTRTSSDWLTALARIDVPAMPMHDLESVLSDPHLQATGFFGQLEHPSEGSLRTLAPSIQWSGTPTKIEKHAPRLGENSVAVMREAGYEEEDINALLTKGVLREPS